MNRHKRRKLARARKEAKAAKLNARAMMVLREELQKRNLHRAKPARSPRGLQSVFPSLQSCIYLRGYGTGMNKAKPLGERALRELRARDRS